MKTTQGNKTHGKHEERNANKTNSLQDVNTGSMFGKQDILVSHRKIVTKHYDIFGRCRKNHGIGNRG